MQFQLKIQKREENFAGERIEPSRIYGRALHYLGQKSVAYARANTPVKTGRLRNGWQYETNPGARTVTIKNNVPYGEAVNNGHRQEPGRYVPGIGRDGRGRKLKRRFVKGRHMLEKASITARNYDVPKAEAMAGEDWRREKAKLEERQKAQEGSDRP